MKVMPIDSATMSVRGSGGETTFYDLELVGVEYDGGVATATVESERDGRSAFVDNASVSLTIGGQEVSTATESISPSPTSFTISGLAPHGVGRSSTFST